MYDPYTLLEKRVIQGICIEKLIFQDRLSLGMGENPLEFSNGNPFSKNASVLNPDN